jgi:hypothetical protein
MAAKLIVKMPKNTAKIACFASVFKLLSFFWKGEG